MTAEFDTTQPSGPEITTDSPDKLDDRLRLLSKVIQRYNGWPDPNELRNQAEGAEINGQTLFENGQPGSEAEVDRARQLGDDASFMDSILGDEELLAAYDEFLDAAEAKTA